MSSHQSTTEIQSRGGNDGPGGDDNGALLGRNLDQPHGDGGENGGGFGGGEGDGLGDHEFGPPQFQIAVSGGTVTGISEVFGSHSATLKIPSNATFTVGTGTVTETLTGTHETTVITFTTDTANTSVFDITNVTNTVTTPTTTAPDGDTAGFSFTITGGAVTAEQFSVTEDGTTHTRTITPPSDATFTVGTGTITETFAAGNTVQTITLVQPTGSTLYAVGSTSTTIVPAGSATTALNIEPFERAKFTVDSSGHVTPVQTVAPDGTATTVTPGSDVSFTQLAPGYVEEVRTHGSHSSFEVFFAGSGSNGVYTAVAEGQGSTVDLVGLQAQIAALPSSASALI
jgi:hypothetical protein